MNENAIPLRDLHLPDAIGWWPLAPGWWGVLVILAVGLAYTTWRLYRRWQFNAPRIAIPSCWANSYLSCCVAGCWLMRHARKSRA